MTIAQTIYKRVLKLMGNRFEISVVAAEQDTEFAEHAIDAAVEEIQRIEQLLTTYREDSQTIAVNLMAGIRPVQVDREFFDLVARSVRLSSLTQGAFDITYGSIDKRLWNFDKTMTALPDPETARQMVKLINYRNIILDDEACTIFLKEPGMVIGFGGIGKGYAAEMARRVLRQRGIESGIVNAAGDLVTWGVQPDGKPWTIGIAHPDAKDWPFSYLAVSNMAVATSGNYEKFVWIGGKKYSHTIDPRTGLTVQGIKSVTIICPNAEIADAMATPVMIMGVKAGLDLINQVRDIACIVIDDHNNMYTSSNIKIH
ncbi:MAG TPA: thiamine biosynthesis protein ApbE [Chitinophagaceae bacterium]|nr:thiamine biosynthesis protein ApbE [Chitinophagaceae bacterium]